MELTGAYHYPILMFLKQHGIFVSVVNAYLMKKYSMISIRKGKTDPLDSIKIASYGIDYWYRLVDFEPAEETYQELRNLDRQNLNYLTMRVKAKQAMAKLIDRGSSMFLHTHDRIWDAGVIIYTGGKYESYIILPIILEE